jgi:predicted enzyme related to lactoylglutathione lyase
MGVSGMGGNDQRRTYPHGVPCRVAAGQPDPRAAARFYSGLFGWATEDAEPAAAPGTCLVARVGGREVAAIGQAESAGDAAGWMTYISVTSADEAAAATAAAGGEVIREPRDAGPGGRAAICADPSGAVFGLRQPRLWPGAQLVNVPGAWNFSHLHTSDQGAARAFYATVFGWQYDDMPGGQGTSIRVPGYGDHLAATVDPGIYERQAGAPPGFADVIGGMQPARPAEHPHWHVTFSVADRDASAATAERLGATVLSSSESAWARFADIRDPQGAQFTISQFRPPA